MAFQWNYDTDKSRRGKTPGDFGNSSKTRVTPFKTKVYNEQDGEWYPVYTPYDATSEQEGIVWLTDNVDKDYALDASRGYTAVSPNSLVEFVKKHTLIKDSSFYPGGGVSSPQVVEGNINFTGTVNLPNAVAGTASKLNPGAKIAVKVGNSAASQGVTFTGANDITVNVTKVDANAIDGVIPLDKIPQGALERLVTVPNQSSRFALTKTQVQVGDTVKQLDTEEVYIVVDDTKLNSEAGYEKFSAGTATNAKTADAFSTAKSITLTGDVTGTASSTGGWTIPTTYNGVVPASKGGTGQTSLQATRKAMGLGDTLGALPIANGGTGATTAAQALKNLGVNATATELNYCSGVTSNIQSQINSIKDSVSTSFNYAGSDSVGGPANNVKGTATSGSTTTGRHIWFSNASTETARDYSDSLKYTPSGNIISANISGNANTATTATTATTASKTANSLTISLNGTSQGAWNGSAAKTINITPSSIGAATTGQLGSYLPLSGGNLTGRVNSTSDFVLNNNVSYKAKTTGGTVTSLIFMNTSNQIQLGENSSTVIHTGNLQLHQNSLGLNSDNITMTASSSSATYGNCYVNFSDNSGNQMGDLRTSKQSDNRNAIQIECIRTIGSTTYYNNMRFYIGPNGEQTYSVSNATNFRSAIGANNATNITTGVLSAARGGTGYTTLQATRNAMGLGNTTGALPIANGGTGATAKKAAKDNLGITSGTGNPPSSGTYGDIYIQYS